MLRISKLTDYATLITNVLVDDWQTKISAVDIAQKIQIPLPTASKVLKMLAHAGILNSYRGAEGGYALARDPNSISLAELITAMEGPMALTECNLDEGVCEHEGNCMLQDNWHSVNAIVMEVLGKVTLAEMAKPIPKPIYPAEVLQASASPKQNHVRGNQE